MIEEERHCWHQQSVIGKGLLQFFVISGPNPERGVLLGLEEVDVISPDGAHRSASSRVI